MAGGFNRKLYHDYQYNIYLCSGDQMMPQGIIQHSPLDDSFRHNQRVMGYIPSFHSLVDGLMIPNSSSLVTALGLRSTVVGFFLRF